MPALRPFLFDIGNVLCTFDFEPMLETLRARSTHLGADPLQRFAETKDLYETGDWSDDEFATHVIEAIGFDGDHAEFAKLWTSVFEENTAMSRVVDALSDAGHPLYLLSNTNGLHLEFLRETFAVFGRFDDGIYSHEAGAIKPMEPIYEIAFERFSLRPEETFYIDDLPDNIATGERFGLISHRYDHRDHTAFERWLYQHGVTID